MSDVDDEPGRELERDENGKALVYGGLIHHDEDYWTDERVADLERLNAAARALAPSLVGLTVDAAQHLVSQHPGLSVLFMYPGCGYPAKGVFGQISAHVSDDVVVSAF